MEQPDRVREIQDAFSAKNDATTIDLERLDQGVATPRRENPQHAYERSMWNATRGLAPRVEIQCVVAEGGEAQVRARNDGANTCSVHYAPDVAPPTER